MKQSIFTTALLMAAMSATSQSNCLRDLTDGLPKANFFASGDNLGEEYDRAFNNVNSAGNKWFRGGHNTSAAAPNWIGVNFGVGGGTGKAVTGYLLSSANDFPGRAPANWEFQGSNDGLNWTVLHTVSGNAFDYPGQSKVFSFSNASSYLQYRFLITETVATNESSIQIGEIELYEEVCIEGIVKDNNNIPLSGVTVAILGETYSISGGGGNIIATAVTDATGNYIFSPTNIPNGQFSVIVQPPVGYQIYENTLPLFYNLNWTNADEPFSLTKNRYTYAGAIPFQNHEQLDMPAGNVHWDGQKNGTFINRFTPNVAKGAIDFTLKLAEVSQACANLNGSPPYINNLITVAANGTFGNFNQGTDSGSYLKVHPTQPGFSKDYTNTLLFGNEGFSNPQNTDYTYSNKINLFMPDNGWGAGVTPMGGNLSISSYIGTIADLIDVAGSPGNSSSSLVNISEYGWRKTYGTTTGDVYDKFLIVNGQLGASALFKQSNLDLKANTNYLFSFDGKNANAFTQTVANATVVTITYHLYNAANAQVATGTLTLPKSTSVLTDHPGSAWEKVFATITPPSDGIYRLELRTAGGPEVGNDFYVDNISLRAMVDYSDAPISYGEASHSQSVDNINNLCDPTLLLGNFLDVENAAHPSSDAKGDDDNNGMNDEDGVMLPILSIGSTGYSLSVDATNLTANAATLYAWIDWDRSGTFDASELQSISVSSGVINGTFSLTWSGVQVLSADPIFARFRLSSDLLASSPTGKALGGEVEDYMIVPTTPTNVRWHRFDVEKMAQSVLLGWQTLSEDNNKGFYIEHSEDGKGWESIGFVISKSAAENSDVELNYDYVHEHPTKGINYYRLKQMDFDGKFEYSVVRTIKFAGTTEMNVYPNPAFGRVLIEGLNGDESISIFDVSGQVLRNVSSGKSEKEIDISDLVPGIYFIKITYVSGSFQLQRLVKLN